MPVFKREEYAERVRKTRQAMQSRGMDVLIVSHPANMNYLTGYDGWSFYVHQCVIVALEQEEVMWVGRNMDGNGADITTFLPKDNIRRYADDYVHSTEKHPMNFVADVIKEKGWAGKRIGVEMDQFFFTHRCYIELHNDLPKAPILDGNALVNWVRVIKSDAEIELMSRAGQIAVKVMDAAIAGIDVGIRECDAAARIVHAEYSGTEQYGGDYPAIVPLIMAGEATKTPHMTWSDRPFKKDEAVLLELAGAYKHYHCPIARTIFLGKEPPQLMKDTAALVMDGLRRTLEFIKPGMMAEEVEAEWRRHSTVKKESRLGYSIGVNYPPDWGEHTISLRPKDKTILKPNMALHLIPGIWFDDVGFEIDASIVITETGYRPLFQYPMEIFLK
ncbi:MAG: M24 family metallopeptidase [Spirochaetota bacterium]